MEKQDIKVTKEDIINFREEYGLTSAEIIPVLDQGISTISRFIEGKIDRLDNEEYVRNLIDDENALKARIRDLYIRGLITRHIYMKFFISMQEQKEVIYVRDVLLREGITYFMEKYEVSFEDMAVIMGLGREKLSELLKCNLDKRLNAEELRKIVSNEQEFVNNVLKQRARGTIKRRNATSIVKRIKAECNDIIIEKEETINNNKEKQIKEVVKNEKESTEVKEEVKKAKPKQRIKYVSAERRKEKNIKMARRAAFQELEKEIDGRTTRTNKRMYFIELLYEKYQEGGKITEEDIDIIKTSIAAHPDLVSNYTLRLVVLGAIKTLGYQEANKNINYLISVVKEPQYKEKLLKYKDIVRDAYQKSRILRLQLEGKRDAEIMKELGLGSREYYRIVEVDYEKM